MPCQDELFPDDLPLRLLDDRFVETLPQRYAKIAILREGDEPEVTRQAVLLPRRGLPALPRSTGS